MIVRLEFAARFQLDKLLGARLDAVRFPQIDGLPREAQLLRRFDFGAEMFDDLLERHGAH